MGAEPKYNDLVAQIEGTLLFGALVFTCAISLPLAFEVEELPMVDRAYENGGQYGCTVEPGIPYTAFYDKPYSQVLSERSFAAVYMSGLAIWLAFVNFISLTNINTQDSYGELARKNKDKNQKKKKKKNKDKKKGKGSSKKASNRKGSTKKQQKAEDAAVATADKLAKALEDVEEKKKILKRKIVGASSASDPPSRYEVKAWWVYGRWVYFVSIMTLAGGTISTFNCWGNIAVMKLPNTYMANLCKDAGWKFDHVDEETGAKIYVNGSVVAHPTDPWDLLSGRHTSPDGWFTLWSGLMTLGVIVSVTLGGWGIMKADMKKYGKGNVPYFLGSKARLDDNLHDNAHVQMTPEDWAKWKVDNLGEDGNEEGDVERRGSGVQHQHQAAGEQGNAYGEQTYAGFN